MSLTVKERIDVVLFAGNQLSYREIADEFNRLHPDRKPISSATVGNLLARFKKTGAVYNKKQLVPENKCYNEVPLLERFSGSLRNSEEQTVNGLTDSKRLYRLIRTQKGHHCVLLKVDENMVDKLVDVLVHFELNCSFFFFDGLNKFCLGPQSSSLFTVAKQDPEEVPFFKAISAADLLGTFEKGRSSAGLVTSKEQNPLKKRSQKNLQSVPFNWIPESSFDDTDSQSGLPAIHEEQCKKGYVNCHLCKNMILASRFSNLSRHARRHAVVKKYECAHCDVQHNEHFKAQVGSHSSNCRTELDPTTSITNEGLTPSFHEETSSCLEQNISADVKSESWVAGNRMQSSSKAAYNYDGHMSPDQVSEVMADDEDCSDSDPVLCHLCYQPFVLANLTNVAEHAKEHYYVKQFECELCGFANNRRLQVRSHAFHQHLYQRPRIIEHNDENMKKAWTQVARICFPSLPRRLMKEKMKYLRSHPTSEVVFETAPSNVSKSGC
ncbi:unnamed protein product [Angiostrongylus costaricensis]|uniref:C2H2-type domain-containing protein n=1 Tax=Angiostrongylus costaricensis TaxID=334426 RepID=A0A158PF87_ANGCS|nr:unnamed protein product [Angiostrongylus costaricensis]